MKTLKITLALIGVMFLTVSGVQSDDVTNSNDPTINESSTSIHLIAHRKEKLKRPTKG
ncbi:hypothetical protein OAA67_03245 [Winogradskyella sp.]|nr:hypothetical protein [Winogradskyella sp.]MDB9782678.1 hypothetical protein [Winogradskyella sp.]MDC1503939.1 hypothetical protein [Winogradskyella sp.]